MLLAARQAFRAILKHDVTMKIRMYTFSISIPLPTNVLWNLKINLKSKFMSNLEVSCAIRIYYQEYHVHIRSKR